MPKISAIVLAAGSGSRFGGDKLLQPINLTDELGRLHKRPIGLTSALNVQPHVDEVICVVRPDDQTLIALLNAHNMTTIANPHHPLGLSSSIKVGVASAKPDNAIMICLADMPFIKANSYQDLIQLFSLNTQSITRLTYQTDTLKQSGHPVIFPNNIRYKLLELKGDKGAQALINERPIATAVSDDEGIIFDIDTQQDLLKAANKKASGAGLV